MKKIVSSICLVIGLLFISGAYTSGYAQTTKKTKVRKGWSHKAKDAAIGGVVGAGTGAIVSKDKSKGAIIGGAVGAGTGLIVGSAKDKKSPNRKRTYKTKKVVK